MNRKHIPEVNAGSMADIAFLLLIFFLVTASIEPDVGLTRLLPAKTDSVEVDIKKRNLFEIRINSNDQIMVNDEIISVEGLREKVTAFIDNGGVKTGQLYCGYCKGQRLDFLSEHSDKAILAIQTQRETSYPIYVAVQNEINGAYNDLRNRLGDELFGVSFEVLKKQYQDEGADNFTKSDLNKRIKKIKMMYPKKMVEVTHVKS